MQLCVRTAKATESANYPHLPAVVISTPGEGPFFIDTPISPERIINIRSAELGTGPVIIADDKERNFDTFHLSRKAYQYLLNLNKETSL